MLIGGIHRFSLIDYPGKTSCIVFTQGCNFRCPYCHNPELIEMDSLKHRLMQKPFFDFLQERRGKLDAVVITGGEPTLQQDLPDFMEKIRALGYLVKLDTNGSNPDLLEKLLAKDLVTFIAMDVKAPLKRYAEVTGIECDANTLAALQRSISLVLQSGLDYEFRTTVVKNLLDTADLLKIGRLIEGAREYVLQRFVPSKTYRPEFADASAPDDKELEDTAVELEKSGIKKVTIR